MKIMTYLGAMIKRAPSARLINSSLVILCALSFAACNEESGASQEVADSFGLPGKGDQSCTSSAALCWVGPDADHARALMNAETEVLLGDREPSELIMAIRALEHKLTPDELEALDTFTAQLGQVDKSEEALEERARVVREGFESVYGRVISSYWGAHATLISEVITADQGLSDSKADGASSQLPDALPRSASIKPALDSLWAQGLFGQYLVTMLTLTGAHEYEPSVTPITEREAGLHLAIDQEAERIVSRHSRLAALDSFVAGMASLIPIAGLYISVPYGVYAQFKIRAHMSLELGALYGLNPQDPNDYLVIVQSMLASQGFKELFSSFYKSLFGAQAYKMIAGRGGNQFLVGADEFSERRVDELVKLSLGQLALYGVRIFEVIKARATGSTARSLLSSVTFGVLTLAEVTLDYLAVKTSGRELRYAFHPWGWASYLEKMPMLADEVYRRCAHSALIEVARADGDVTEREASLMQEALVRPFHAEIPPLGATLINPSSRYKDTSWVAFIDRSSLIEQVNYASYLDPFLCLSGTWSEEDSFTQLSLLSWLELMAHSDGTLDSEEVELLLSYGEQFTVQAEESRVYHAMRDRVASHPWTMSDVSSNLWMWNNDQAESLLDAISDEARIEIWREMR